MLSPEVYNKLYQYASNVSHSNVLEIGAAHGASTIALALGLKESQYDNRVVTFEKGEGGSRAEYGSKEENLEILRGNLAAYEVDDSVSIVPERLDIERGVPDVVQEHAPYSLLCIDADGKLHRDFSLLYDLLEPGAVVIIDDYSLKRDYTEVNEQYPLGGGKDYRTFCYVNHFLETGVLKQLEVIDNTFFGTRSVTTEYPPENASIDTIKTHLENDRQRILESQSSIKNA
jgi:predicted O-methyltransferase YrrM